MLLLNIGAIVWLLLCLAAAYTHPTTIRYISMFSLGAPLAILANMLFVLYWLVFSSRKLRAVLSTVALIVCYKLVVMIWGFSYFEKNDLYNATGRLKVMHWNCHGMGIFEKANVSSYEKKMMDYIHSVDADIVCLPEFNVPKYQIMTPAANAIMRKNGFVDYRFQADNTLGRNTFLGTAVFSRYPMFNFRANKLTDYIYLLQADVRINTGDTLRMFFAHLNTFGLSDQDKDYIEKLTKNQTGVTAGVNRARSYLWKFNYAFVRRAKEVAIANDIILQSPYPVIITGDLNDLPASYTYTQLKGELSDAFVEKGTGLGRTYNRLSPTLRIDFIFFDPTLLKCIGYRSDYTALSDHNPVIANFEILSRQ